MALLLFIVVTAGLIVAGLAVPLMLRRIPPNTLYGLRIAETYGARRSGKTPTPAPVETSSRSQR
ncbi:MAG TPA: hypothetical protein RMG48_02800 [Myxococcales bacterium LLY-WYZ-16_1]|jgi:hypothetical protein|nr:hypothetical protein [Myxococcales bacterium LLY-WYZ-16_1]